MLFWFPITSFAGFNSPLLEHFDSSSLRFSHPSLSSVLYYTPPKCDSSQAYTTTHTEPPQPHTLQRPHTHAHSPTTHPLTHHNTHTHTPFHKEKHFTLKQTTLRRNLLCLAGCMCRELGADQTQYAHKSHQLSYLFF